MELHDRLLTADMKKEIDVAEEDETCKKQEYDTGAYFEFPTLAGRVLTATENTHIALPFRISFTDVQSMMSTNFSVEVNKLGIDFGELQCRIRCNNRTCVIESGQKLKCTRLPEFGEYKFHHTASRSDNPPIQWIWSAENVTTTANLTFNIHYPAAVKALSLSVANPAESGSQVYVVCTWDAGNAAVAAYLLDGQGVTLKTVSSVTGEIHYRFAAVGCEDDGLIRCQAPGASHNQSVSLIVRCPPQIVLTGIQIQADQQSAVLELAVSTRTPTVLGCKVYSISDASPVILTSPDSVIEARHEIQRSWKCLNDTNLTGGTHRFTLDVPVNCTRGQGNRQLRVELTNHAGTWHNFSLHLYCENGSLGVNIGLPVAVTRTTTTGTTVTSTAAGEKTTTSGTLTTDTGPPATTIAKINVAGFTIAADTTQKTTTPGGMRTDAGSTAITTNRINIAAADTSKETTARFAMITDTRHTAIHTTQMYIAAFTAVAVVLVAAIISVTFCVAICVRRGTRSSAVQEAMQVEEDVPVIPMDIFEGGQRSEGSNPYAEIPEISAGLLMTLKPPRRHCQQPLDNPNGYLTPVPSLPELRDRPALPKGYKQPRTPQLPKHSKLFSYPKQTPQLFTDSRWLPNAHSLQNPLKERECYFHRGIRNTVKPATKTRKVQSISTQSTQLPSEHPDGCGRKSLSPASVNQFERIRRTRWKISTEARPHKHSCADPGGSVRVIPSDPDINSAQPAATNLARSKSPHLHENEPVNTQATPGRIQSTSCSKQPLSNHELELHSTHHTLDNSQSVQHLQQTRNLRSPFQHLLLQRSGCCLCSCDNTHSGLAFPADRENTRSGLAFPADPENTRSDLAFPADRENTQSGLAFPADSENTRSGLAFPADHENNRSGLAFPADPENTRSGLAFLADRENTRSGLAFLADRQNTRSGLAFLAHRENRQSGLAFPADCENTRSGLAFSADRENTRSGLAFSADRENTQSGLAFTADRENTRSGLAFPVDRQNTRSGLAFPAYRENPRSGLAFLADRENTRSGLTFPANRENTRSDLAFPADRENTRSGQAFPADRQNTRSGLAFPAEREITRSGLAFPADRQNTRSGLAFPAKRENTRSGLVFPADRQNTRSGLAFPADGENIRSGLSFPADRENTRIGQAFSADHRSSNSPSLAHPL